MCEVGKSTLVQNAVIGARRVYRSLDDLAVLGLAERDPVSLVKGADKVTLDEIETTLPGTVVDTFDADVVMAGGFPLSVTAASEEQRNGCQEGEHGIPCC